MSYVSAFPAELQAVASALLPALAIGEQWPASQGFTVRVQSQPLSAPGRVYYEPSRLRSVIESSSEEARALALCLGTRHWDGFIREECLRKVILVHRPWVIPFVIQLVGEYVIEIIRVVVASIQCFDRTGYRSFLLQNPEFIATTKCRAISYWNCYYRSQYPRREDYPGLRVIEEVENMRDAAL